MCGVGRGMGSWRSLRHLVVVVSIDIRLGGVQLQSEWHRDERKGGGQCGQGR